MRRRITPQQRRHQDYLRQKGLKTGALYMRSLARSRAKEVRRVLELCRSYDDAGVWPRIIENELSEAGYFAEWLAGLYVEAGLPNARSIARDLSRGKAADPSGMWETRLRQYATEQAGRRIVSVSGTLKEALVAIVREELEEDINAGIEALNKRVYGRFTELNVWQCRRIAQTETMIGLAESANEAAKTLEIPFVKEWCISGVGNTRASHQEMDGVTVDEDEYFELFDDEGGARMLYPHDQSTNPPAQEIINCACSCIRLPK